MNTTLLVGIALGVLIVIAFGAMLDAERALREARKQLEEEEKRRKSAEGR